MAGKCFLSVGRNCLWEKCTAPLAAVALLRFISHGRAVGRSTLGGCRHANCFLDCFDLGLFGDHKAKGWASSEGAILLWLMKKTSKWRGKRKEVKLDKRLGLKSEKCFLYFSLLCSKQVFDSFNLTLANFKQNEFSSSLVPFCLASLSLHTCWSLAEQSRPCPCAPPSQPWWQLLPARLLPQLCCSSDHLQMPSICSIPGFWEQWPCSSSPCKSLPWFFFHSELPFIGGVLKCWLWVVSQDFWYFRAAQAECCGSSFLQGSAYDLPSYVLTAFTLLFPRIHF